MKEAEVQLQTENASLLQQLHQKVQEAKELRQQKHEQHQHMHQHQFEQETRLAQLQLQLQEVQEQFRSLQNLHLQQQQQSAIDSEALSSTHPKWLMIRGNHEARDTNGYVGKAAFRTFV